MVESLSHLANQITNVATQKTTGEFLTEEDSTSEFDRLVELTGLFKIKREVWGQYVNNRPNLDSKKPRIDRILIPKQRLLDQGWRHGPIAVECKKSGSKLGRLIAQALDYSSAVFEVSPGFHVWCEWLFVWPLDRTGGDIESVMLQNRIGICHPFVSNKQNVGLNFKAGATVALRVHENETIDCCRELPQGRKRGSR